MNALGARHRLHGQRRGRSRSRCRRLTRLSAVLRDELRPDRHQGRLRRRRLRRLHGAARRRAGLRLPGAGRLGRRARGAHGRGPRQRQRCRRCRRPSCAWRGAMRHLHARPAGGRDGAAGAQPAARRGEVQDALGGVLCRCTGYRKIIAAVMDASTRRQPTPLDARLPGRGHAVGASPVRLDGMPKVTGARKIRRRRLSRRRAGRAGGPLAASPCAASPSAISTASAQRIPGIAARLHRRRHSRATTASASSRPSPTSRRWPKASRASAARRWRWSPASARRCADLDLAGFPDHLDRTAACARRRPRRRRRARALHPCATARQSADRRASSSAAIPRRALAACRHRRLRRASRPPMSSTPISSRRPATPAWTATRWSSPPAPRRPTWTATIRPACSACRPTRCASCRPPPAAASAPSSTSRCSR